MSLELFTVATKLTPGMDRLQIFLAKLGWRLTVLGEGEEFQGHAWRWKMFVRAARRSPADVVVHCDAYDALPLSTPDEFERRFQAVSMTLGEPVIFARRYNAKPKEEFYETAEPGLCAATPFGLENVFTEDWLEAVFFDTANDMYQIEQLWGNERRGMAADVNGLLFYSRWQAAPPLVTDDVSGRLVNAATGNDPCFVHGPLQAPLSDVEQWLQTHVGTGVRQ